MSYALDNHVALVWPFYNQPKKYRMYHLNCSLPSSNVHSSKEQCSICLRNAINLTLIVDCLHGFCYDCIRLWAQHLLASNILTPTCPLCKQSFTQVMTDIDSTNSHFRYCTFTSPTLMEIQSDIYTNRRSVYTRQLLLYKIGDEIVLDYPTSELYTKTHKSWETLQVWITRELEIVLDSSDNHLILCVLQHHLVKQRSELCVDLFIQEFTSELHHYLRQDQVPIFVRELGHFNNSMFNLSTYDSEISYTCKHHIPHGTN